MDHYEVWGGFCADSEHGAPSEFLETAMSWEEAKTACDEYRKHGYRYAYVRDMNNNGETVY